MVLGYLVVTWVGYLVVDINQRCKLREQVWPCQCHRSKED
jgi:hypothetical protein